MTLPDRLVIAALMLIATSGAFAAGGAAALLNDVWELAFWRSFAMWGFASSAFAGFLGFVAGPAAMERYLGAAPDAVAPRSREVLVILGAMIVVGWVLLVQELA